MKAVKLIIVLLLLLPTISNAQDETVFWSSLELKRELSKKLTATAGGNFRTTDRLSDWDSYFSEFKIEYKLPKEVDVELEYRRVRNQDSRGAIQGIEKWSRLRLNLLYTYKPIRGALKVRFGYEERFAHEGTNGNARARRRVKLSYKYPIKNWKADPTFFSEYLDSVSNQFSDSWRIGVFTHIKMQSGRIGLRFFREERLDFGRDRYVADIRYQFQF